MVPLLIVVPQESVDSALSVFATGVESALWLIVMGGLLFGTLRYIRRFLGIGRDEK